MYNYKMSTFDIIVHIFVYFDEFYWISYNTLEETFFVHTMRKISAQKSCFQPLANSNKMCYNEDYKPLFPPESLEGKFSRLDLNLKVDNRLVNIEIQVKNEPDYRDRTLFYWAKLYSSELKSGEDYSEVAAMKNAKEEGLMEGRAEERAIAQAMLNTPNGTRENR